MKVTYRSPNGRLEFEQEGLDRKTAFAFVAAVQELFEEPECGMCHCKDIQHRVQEHDGNKFYKLVCPDCGAQADFGQRKDGTGMWLKRDKEGGVKGWYKWQRGRDESQSSGYQQHAPRQEEASQDIPF
jgi:hypothetical protein